jgi:tetratricopeptide (TPR) repeat protein
LWFYAAKLVWPRNLIFIYPRWTISSAHVSAYGYLAGCLAGFAVLAVLSRRTRAPLAGALIFAGTLFPTLGFLNVYAFIFSYVADHWQYLACLGIVVPVCSGLARVTRGLAIPVRAASGAALLGVLGALTFLQAETYHDVETFYRTILARNPGAWMAHNNLAIILQDKGRTSEALDHYAEALRSDSTIAEVHNNFATALADAGRLAESEREYQSALALNPRYFVAWNNYGALLERTGRLPEALAAFDAALHLKPDYLSAHFNRGNTLLDSGQIDAAVAEFREAVRERPADPTLAQGLRSALELQNKGSAKR